MFFAMSYNDIHRHARDSRIRFDAAAHSYLAELPDGTPVPCDSVTTIVEDFFEKFDADYWAARKATAERPAEVIKAEWAAKGQAARDLGTQLHDRIERHYLGEEPEPEALADPAFRNFMVFAGHRRLTPYRSEWRIFSERYRIAGTLDFLAFDGERFEIYDWKRSSKIVDEQGRPITGNRYGKCAKAPIAHIPDCTYHHYALQVSLYRYLLALEYGIEVAAGHLGTFHPHYDRPYIVEMPYYKAEVETILASRLR